MGHILLSGDTNRVSASAAGRRYVLRFFAAMCSKCPVCRASEIRSENRASRFRRGRRYLFDYIVYTSAHAAAQAKEDFEIRLKASLAEMEKEIERLHEKGHALKDEAKARWKEKMADLEAKQKAACDKLDEVRKSTGEAWGHMEKGAQVAWDDVRKAFQDAAKEF